MPGVPLSLTAKREKRLRVLVGWVRRGSQSMLPCTVGWASSRSKESWDACIGALGVCCWQYKLPEHKSLLSPSNICKVLSSFKYLYMDIVTSTMKQLKTKTLVLWLNQKGKKQIEQTKKTSQNDIWAYVNRSWSTVQRLFFNNAYNSKTFVCLSFRISILLIKIAYF